MPAESPGHAPALLAADVDPAYNRPVQGGATRAAFPRTVVDGTPGPDVSIKDNG